MKRRQVEFLEYFAQTLTCVVLTLTLTLTLTLIHTLSHACLFKMFCIILKLINHSLTNWFGLRYDLTLGVQTGRGRFHPECNIVLLDIFRGPLAPSAGGSGAATTAALETRRPPSSSC